MLVWVVAAAGILLLLTGGFVLATRLVARHRRKIFLEGLGGVVRIGTPCRVVDGRGRALIPGTVALTPAGLVWQALLSAPGAFTFEEIRRLETDDHLSSGRGLLRSKILRVTPVRGEAVEFVVSPGHAWEWRQALGEWTASRGRIAGADAARSGLRS